MQRPAVVAAILVLGVIALGYNVWTYSQLFRKPTSSEVSSVTQDGMREARRSDFRAGPVEEGVGEPLSGAALAAILDEIGHVDRNPFRFAGPFRVGMRSEGATALPTLQGILHGEGRRVAWVNGRAYSEGSEIDGYLLERIEVDHVVLVREGQEWTVVPTRAAD